MEEVNKLYKEYQQAKGRAEQYMFPFIALFDKTIEQEYKDIQKTLAKSIKHCL